VRDRAVGDGLRPVQQVLTLIDVIAERTGLDGTAPATLPAKEVARRVIETAR
jgi:hypothetical protein